MSLETTFKFTSSDDLRNIQTSSENAPTKSRLQVELRNSQFVDAT